MKYLWRNDGKRYPKQEIGSLLGHLSKITILTKSLRVQICDINM